MEEIEVDVIQIQESQGGLDALLGGLVAEVLEPELRGDEELFAGDSGGADCASHGGLVLVCGGGIDMPVAGFQCLQDRPLGVLTGRNLEDAEALCGDFGAISECEGGCGHFANWVCRSPS